MSPRRLRVLLAGLAAIAAWQWMFFHHAERGDALQNGYKLTASNGVAEWQPEFVYFLYHLNLYPVVSLSESRRPNSVEGARRLISDEGASLAMDRFWTVRYGDLAKTYLYLPSAWARGTAARPRMLHANAIGFTFALLALFASLWYVGRATLGLVLVLLLGSNPFQVTEVYATNNLFGWPVTITLVLLALHVPFLSRAEGWGWRVLLLAAASGLLLGTVRHVRSEQTLAILGVAFVYLTATRIRLLIRLAAVAALAAAFTAASAGWTAYFDAKFREAQRVVRTAGGHVYNGPRHAYHFFWHALWCGLGDFDQKYGHRWSDITAYSYAWSIRQQQQLRDPAGYPPTAATSSDVFSLGVYWDEGRQYPRTPYEMDEYLEIIRGKVVRDIAQDPGWYLAILARRTWRLLAESTPPTIALGNGMWSSLPGRSVWGLLGLCVCLALLRRRQWFELKLIAFTMPLAGTALVVYSGGGTTLYSVAHLVAFAVGCLWTVEALRRSRLKSPAEPASSPVWRRPSRRQWSLIAASLVACTVVLLASWIGARRALRAAPDGAASDRPLALVVPRFANETSDERQAWVGDAVADAIASQLEQAGVRTLAPEAVDNLDAEIMWWGPFGTPSAPRAIVANVAVDRSGAQHVLLGRIRPGPRGPLACATLFTARTREELAPEICEPHADRRLLEASRSLAAALLPRLGVAASLASDVGARPDEVEALRLRTEALLAVRLQEWGRADGMLRDGEALRASLRMRWQPLAVDSLRSVTGASDPAGAIAVLEARIATSPGASEPRIQLGRILVALELHREAQEVLDPLQRTPWAPPDAFGLSAEALSARGELGRGYLALREYLRRSWREPRAGSLLAQHLVRWQDAGRASQTLDDAARDRVRRGAVEVTLDDLVTRWQIAMLQNEWGQAKQVAYRMGAIDDPRAEGVSNLHLATSDLFRGRLRLALAHAEEAASQLARRRLDASAAIRLAAEIALEQGDPQGALGVIRARGPAATADQRIVALEALALARLGRLEESGRLQRRLAESLPRVPGPTLRRELHLLDGEIALLRGDASAASRSFAQAERLLAPRGFCGDHVRTWYGLGRSHLAKGDRALAEAWFKRVAGASFERLCWPIPYTRSLDAVAGSL